MAMLNDASGLIRYTLSAVTRISGPVLIPWIPFWNPGNQYRFTFLRAENGPGKGLAWEKDGFLLLYKRLEVNACSTCIEIDHCYRR